MMERVLQLILYSDIFPVHFSMNYEQAKLDQYYRPIEKAILWDTKIEYEIIDNNFINQFLTQLYNDGNIFQQIVEDIWYE